MRRRAARTGSVAGGSCGEAPGRDPRQQPEPASPCPAPWGGRGARPWTAGFPSVLCVHTLARGSEQGQAGVWGAGVFCVWMRPGDLMTWLRVSGSAGRRFHGEPRRPGPSGLGLVCVMNVGGSSSHRNYLKGFQKRENKFNQTITVVPPSGAECIFRNVGLVQSLPVFMCYHSN